MQPHCPQYCSTFYFLNYSFGEYESNVATLSCTRSIQLQWNLMPTVQSKNTKTQFNVWVFKVEILPYKGIHVQKMVKDFPQELTCKGPREKKEWK